MFPNPPGSVTIKISREWDSGLMQTTHLQPRGSAGALLHYDLDPLPVDAGMPPIVAAAFGRALPQLGVFAGRWFDHEIPLGDVQFIPGKHRLIRRLVSRQFIAAGFKVESR